jgi:hypothetical protein
MGRGSGPKRVKIINSSGLTDMTAYLSVPADSQPNVPGWVGNIENTHHEALGELKNALQKLGIKILVKTRIDASVPASMKVDESRKVTVNKIPW